MTPRRTNGTSAQGSRPTAAKARKRPHSVSVRQQSAPRPRHELWSGRVTRTSNALDLEPGVFKKRSAREIAASLKRSAEASGRRKSSPFRSAMSMLNFEINRAGRHLSMTRRQTLERAKIELRKEFRVNSATPK